MIVSNLEFEDLPYKLETRVPLTQSALWDLQWRYYAEQGADAWRNGQVPHYVTSNPTVANCYAEIILACRRDYLRNANLLDGESQPITICELGAGSGRLGFQIVSILERLQRDIASPNRAFRYVLTDFAQSNLDAWRSYPKFQPLLEYGALDLALFDVKQSEAIELQICGETIRTGSLETPLVVIANYLFDSVPQDLYYFNRGQTRTCSISLAAGVDPETTSAADLVSSIQVQYSINQIPEILAEHTVQEQILTRYQNTIDDAYLLFPSVALDCLDRMKGFSPTGMLLLTADKGDHALADLQGQSPPPLVRHGSFSYTVNYNAFEQYCALNNGVALFPERQGPGLTFGALIVTQNAELYGETRNAYARFVQDSSPTDFRTMAALVRRSMDDMSVEEILAFLRTSHYDAHQLLRLLPRLSELIGSMSPSARSAVTNVIERVWEMYLPLGEPTDLANQIARLLYDMDEYSLAIKFFLRSIELYGDIGSTLFSLAASYYLTSDYSKAGSFLCTILERDPENEQAQELLEKCIASLNNSIPQTVEL